MSIAPPLSSTELESGLRGGRSFGGDLTCEGLRAEDGGGTRRRDGAAEGAAGPDGGVRVGAAHGHRRLLPHLGPPVQRPLLYRRRPRGAPVRPQFLSTFLLFSRLRSIISCIGPSTQTKMEGIKQFLLGLLITR